eukprot:3019055-Rhodomonas_salina.3
MSVVCLVWYGLGLSRSIRREGTAVLCRSHDTAGESSICGTKEGPRDLGKLARLFGLAGLFARTHWVSTAGSVHRKSRRTLAAGENAPVRPPSAAPPRASAPERKRERDSQLVVTKTLSKEGKRKRGTAENVRGGLREQERLFVRMHVHVHVHARAYVCVHARMSVACPCICMHAHPSVRLCVRASSCRFF